MAKYILEMWMKEGSVRGYGRKKVFEDEGGKPGPYMCTQYGWMKYGDNYQYPKLVQLDEHQIVIDPYESEERDLKNCEDTTRIVLYTDG